jgi:hypothetical protein
MAYFYSWLLNTKKISEDNMQKLFTISTMYDVPDQMDVCNVVESKINWNMVRQIMSPYGFLIPPHL